MADQVSRKFLEHQVETVKIAAAMVGISQLSDLTLESSNGTYKLTYDSQSRDFTGVRTRRRLSDALAGAQEVLNLLHRR